MASGARQSVSEWVSHAMEHTPLVRSDPHPLWRQAERVLLAAERDIALLTRCRPENVDQERVRLLECWRAGQPSVPCWTYPRAHNLDRTRVALDALLADLPNDPISRLYAERAQELELERRIACAIATPEFRDLSRQRFAAFDESAAADQLADAWCGLAPAPEAECIPSDANDPRSLYSQLARAVGELRLPFRVTASTQLSAAAATGDGVIVVAVGRELGVHRTRRIVVHEIFGHVLPRVRAEQQELGLFRTGARQGNDQQEGWALQMELEHGVFDDERRRELGLRHHAAKCAHEGADWVETTRGLLERGAQLTAAQDLATRALRGGGLGRERVYLPAWIRLQSALRDEPSLAEWFSLGRLSLEAVHTLRREQASRLTHQ
jgi:hypothetical protein